MPGDYTNYDPNDPNMGSQQQGPQTEAANQQVVDSLNLAIQKDPAVQAWVAAHPGELDDRGRREFRQVIENAGYSVPEGMDVMEDGRVLPIDHTTRNRILTAIMAAPLFLPGSGAGAGAGGATTASSAAPVAGSAGAQALVPSTLGGFTTPGVGSAATTTGLGGSSVGGGSLLSRAGGLLKGKWGDVLGAAGNTVGAATQAAGQNRIDADALNIRGNDAYQTQVNNRSKLESDERRQALRDVYRDSWYDNRQAGPNNTRGLTPMSEQFKTALDTLASQGSAKLATGPAYSTDKMPALDPYKPSQPGTLERIGTWAAPTLSLLSEVGNILKKKQQPYIVD